jgi:hypothetical protein
MLLESGCSAAGSLTGILFRCSLPRFGYSSKSFEGRKRRPKQQVLTAPRKPLAPRPLLPLVRRCFPRRMLERCRHGLQRRPAPWSQAINGLKRLLWSLSLLQKHLSALRTAALP